MNGFSGMIGLTAKFNISQYLYIYPAADEEAPYAQDLYAVESGEVTAKIDAAHVVDGELVVYYYYTWSPIDGDVEGPGEGDGDDDGPIIPDLPPEPVNPASRVQTMGKPEQDYDLTTTEFRTWFFDKNSRTKLYVSDPEKNFNVTAGPAKWTEASGLTVPQTAQDWLKSWCEANNKDVADYSWWYVQYFVVGGKLQNPTIVTEDPDAAEKEELAKAKEEALAKIDAAVKEAEETLTIAQAEAVKEAAAKAKAAISYAEDVETVAKALADFEETVANIKNADPRVVIDTTAKTITVNYTGETEPAGEELLALINKNDKGVKFATVSAVTTDNGARKATAITEDGVTYIVTLSGSIAVIIDGAVAGYVSAAGGYVTGLVTGTKYIAEGKVALASTAQAADGLYTVADSKIAVGALTKDLVLYSTVAVTLDDADSVTASFGDVKDVAVATNYLVQQGATLTIGNQTAREGQFWNLNVSNPAVPAEKLEKNVILDKTFLAEGTLSADYTVDVADRDITIAYKTGYKVMVGDVEMDGLYGSSDDDVTIAAGGLVTGANYVAVNFDETTPTAWADAALTVAVVTANQKPQKVTVTGSTLFAENSTYAVDGIVYLVPAVKVTLDATMSGVTAKATYGNFEAQPVTMTGAVWFATDAILELTATKAQVAATDRVIATYRATDKDTGDSYIILESVEDAQKNSIFTFDTLDTVCTVAGFTVKKLTKDTFDPVDLSDVTTAASGDDAFAGFESNFAGAEIFYDRTKGDKWSAPDVPTTLTAGDEITVTVTVAPGDGEYFAEAPAISSITGNDNIEVESIVLENGNIVITIIVTITAAATPAP